jgi:putative endonuclease
MNLKSKIGRQGELSAELFYKNNKWEILEKNYSANIKYGEIDIIAKQCNTIVFIEVKTRKNKFANPIEMVTKSKQKKIIQTAELYILNKNILQEDFIIRFDIALVNKEDKVFVYENAFQK